MTIRGTAGTISLLLFFVAPFIGAVSAETIKAWVPLPNFGDPLLANVAEWVKTDLETSISADAEHFTLVVRDPKDLDEAMTELQFQLSGLVDEATAKKAGVSVGADWVISSNLIRTDSTDTAEIVLKPLDLETATYPQGIFSVIVGRNRDEVRSGVLALVERLTGGRQTGIAIQGGVQSFTVSAPPPLRIEATVTTAGVDAALRKGVESRFSALKAAARQNDFAAAYAEAVGLGDFIATEQANGFVMKLQANGTFLSSYTAALAASLSSIREAYEIAEMNKAIALLLNYKDAYLKLMLVDAKSPDSAEALGLRTEVAEKVFTLFDVTDFVRRREFSQAYEQIFREATSDLSSLYRSAYQKSHERAMVWSQGSYMIVIEGQSGYARWFSDTTAVYAGRNDITVGEFRAFVHATGYRTSAELNPLPSRDAAARWINWRMPGFAQGDADPVVCVSAFDAMAYCNWLSSLLGLRHVYSIDGETDLAHLKPGWNTGAGGAVASDSRANGYHLPMKCDFDAALRYGFVRGANLDALLPGTAQGTTRPVGRGKPNLRGMYDMVGNVRQLCWDSDPYFLNWRYNVRSAKGGGEIGDDFRLFDGYDRASGVGYCSATGSWRGAPRLDSRNGPLEVIKISYWGQKVLAVEPGTLAANVGIKSGYSLCFTDDPHAAGLPDMAATPPSLLLFTPGVEFNRGPGLLTYPSGMKKSDILEGLKLDPTFAKIVGSFQAYKVQPVSNVDTALNVDSCYFDSLRPDGFADDIGFRVYSADLHAGPFVEEEVGRLYESSPAAKAGIKEGDVIVAADGQRFDALYSLAALARSELLFASGSVVLRVRRASGSEEELTVVPETNPIDPSSLYLGVPAYCAKVVDLVKSSSAAKAGLEPGDLILGIDGKRFDAAHDLATLLVGKNPGDTVTLLVRKGTDPERMIVIKLGVNPTTKKAFLGIQYQRIPL